MLDLSPSGLLALGEVVWVNALLSGDNALVIALACRNLERRQRTAGMVLGALLAIVLRIAFTVFTTSLLSIPFIKLAGGVVLLWIATKLITDDNDGDSQTPAASTLWHAVRVIVVADAVMSIDNVLAIAAIARGDTMLLSAGLAISVPFVVVGATLISAVLNRLPVLVWAGGALLGWIAGTMAVEDALIAAPLHRFGLAEPVAGVVGAAFVLVLAWALTHAHRPARAADAEEPNR